MLDPPPRHSADAGSFLLQPFPSSREFSGSVGEDSAIPANPAHPEAICEPDFEKFHPFGSDIAMLQLCLPVNFTSYVIPACLPPRDTGLPRHTSYWITGWGKLAEDSKKKRSGTGKGGRKRREPED